jgi:hypothetical protein
MRFNRLSVKGAGYVVATVLAIGGCAADTASDMARKTGNPVVEFPRARPGVSLVSDSERFCRDLQGLAKYNEYADEESVSCLMSDGKRFVISVIDRSFAAEDAEDACIDGLGGQVIMVALGPSSPQKAPACMLPPQS